MTYVGVGACNHIATVTLVDYVAAATVDDDGWQLQHLIAIGHIRRDTDGLIGANLYTVDKDCEIYLQTIGDVSHIDVAYDELGMIPEVFRKLGVNLERRGDDIFVPEQESYVIDSFLDGSILNIADAPWPGLSPDLLSVILVTATQCKGSVLIHQKMFESRLFFVDKLIDMGAQIILCDPHRAVVVGHDHKYQLRAGQMASPDIRAGIALLIAAMSAKGTSVISNIDQIDRGYEDIDIRLNALGAKITRQ